MGENFERIKKKTLLNAVIKCAVCGVSFGIFAAGAALLTLKLIGIHLAFYYYVAIGVGVALLAGGLSFLIFKPNEKRLAKRLDEEYGLQEKLQTALAFSQTSGAVIDMQRRDADARLASLPNTGFSLSKTLPKIWQFILIVLLAVSIALTAFLVPAKYAQGASSGGNGVQDTLFELKNEHIDGLEELIENVEDCEFGENLKASIVTLLNRLENNLFIAETMGEVGTLVNGTIDKIDSLITDSYSYVKISTFLAAYDLYDFAWVLAEGVRNYRSYRFIEYDEVKKYKEFCTEEIIEIVENEETGLPPVFKAIKENKKDGKSDNTPALIMTALMASKVSASDSLYQLFFNLARALASDDGANETQFMFHLEDEIVHQAYFRTMRLYIINTLTTLFELPPCSDPDFKPQKNGGDDEENNDPTRPGGYGDGEWKNNQEVYDPRTGQYGNYMDILKDYYALVDEMLRDPDLSEEHYKIIETYFEYLFNNGQTADKSEEE